MRMFRSIRSLLLTLGMLAMSGASFAQVSIGVAITIAPPELPVYEQPVCPGDGYIWTPGYWAYADDGYYWVPGTWVLAPEVGFLWTPGYWAWESNGYYFHQGYWGPQVGFYGGISYGFGYFGHGYEGGRWDNGHFFYNRSVNNVNVTVVHNVYNTTVVNRTENRVSFNGGNGGRNDRPTALEEAITRERHVPPVAAQTQHVEAARANRELRAAANHGKPPVAATPKPGDFNDRAVVPAREAGAVHSAPAASENNGNGNGNGNHPNPAVHARDLTPNERPAAPTTGNAKQDQKYQQQQQKLQQKQDQERQKLQQKQDQDHQRLEQQKANDAKKQQTEQKHQQQTQQLQQKHVQQQQQMQQHQQPPPPSQPKKP